MTTFPFLFQISLLSKILFLESKLVFYLKISFGRLIKIAVKFDLNNTIWRHVLKTHLLVLKNHCYHFSLSCSKKKIMQCTCIYDPIQFRFSISQLNNQLRISSEHYINRVEKDEDQFIILREALDLLMVKTALDRMKASTTVNELLPILPSSDEFDDDDDMQLSRLQFNCLRVPCRG